jgi:pimeloyl-ACP methyl ester carboxylesterase
VSKVLFSDHLSSPGRYSLNNTRTLVLIFRASAPHQEWFNTLRRVSTSPENAARIMEACDKINFRALLPSVSVPTIVFHSDGDRAVPPDEGRILAAEIPNARFVPLSSANHLLLADEPTWGIFVEELGAFLGWQGHRRSHRLTSLCICGPHTRR